VLPSLFRFSNRSGGRKALLSARDSRKRGISRRRDALILLARGLSLRKVQAVTGMSPRCTLHWKRLWEQKGLAGLLFDAPRSGRPRKLSAADEIRILKAVDHHAGRPTDRSSTRRLAQLFGVSHVTVMRVLHRAGVYPRLRWDPIARTQSENTNVLAVFNEFPRVAIFAVAPDPTADSGPPINTDASSLKSRPKNYPHCIVSLLSALGTGTGQRKFGWVKSRTWASARLRSWEDIKRIEAFRQFVHALALAHEGKHLYMIESADFDYFRDMGAEVHIIRAEDWLKAVEMCLAWMIPHNGSQRGRYLDAVHRIMTCLRRLDEMSVPFSWPCQD
jgi:transposase